MAATSPLFLLSLFILPVLRCSDANTPPIVNVIEALEKLVAFYKNSYRDINLDGLFGLRVIEGQIELIVNEYNHGEHQHIETSIVERLRILVREATEASKQALAFVKKDDEQYFTNFKFLVGSPWAVHKKHRAIDPSLKWHPDVYTAKKNVRLTEAGSDQCMGELSGTSNPGGQSCVISERCMKTMTQRGLTEYSLTHQILWTMVAEKAGCLTEMTKVVKKLGYPDIESLQLELCTNNYFEMMAVVHIFMKGVIKPEYHDLFMEQQFVCPSIGFYQYLGNRYLKQMLTWQSDSGCFVDNEASSYEDVPIEKHDSHSFNQHLGAHREDKLRDKDMASEPRVINMKAPLPSSKTLQLKQGNSLKFNPAQNDRIGGKFNHPNLHNIQQNRGQNSIGQPGKKSLQFSQKQAPLRSGNGTNTSVSHISVIQSGSVLKQDGHKLTAGGNLDSWKQQQVGEHPNLAGGLFPGRTDHYKSAHRQRRRLLVEKTMRGGCLSHKTAVGAGALVMYLHYLIDPGPMDMTPPEGSRALLQKPDMSAKDSQKEGLIPAKEKLDEDELALNQMAPALEDREVDDGGGEGAGPDAREQSEEYEGEEGEEEEDEDEAEEEEEEYADKDMYPDKEEDIRDRKIVHFGGGDPKNRLVDGNGFGSVKAGGGLANNMDVDLLLKGDNPQANVDDAEYTYYEEPEKEDGRLHQANVRRDVPVVKSYHKSRTRNHSDRHVSRSADDASNTEGLGKMTFIVFSVCFLLLFFLMYRFIKKRRIHIRYHPRAMFSL